MDYGIALGVHGQENIATLEAIEGGVLVIFREAVKRSVPVMGDFERTGLAAGVKIMKDQLKGLDPDADADWRGGENKKEKAIDGFVEGLNKNVDRYFLETRRVACVGNEQLIAAIDRAQKCHAKITRLDQEGGLHGGRPPVGPPPSVCG